MEDRDMTLDEALIMLDSPGNYEAKLEVASRTGGLIAATDKAYQIARECLKRCRDFDELRARVGMKIYYTAFDNNFPDMSEVCEYEIDDVSAAGLIHTAGGKWDNPTNPESWLYWTREEAEKALEKMKETAK